MSRGAATGSASTPHHDPALADAAPPPPAAPRLPRATAPPAEPLLRSANKGTSSPRTPGKGGGEGERRLRPSRPLRHVVERNQRGPAAPPPLSSPLPRHHLTCSLPSLTRHACTHRPPRERAVRPPPDRTGPRDARWPLPPWSSPGTVEPECAPGFRLANPLLAPPPEKETQRRSRRLHLPSSLLTLM